jgi:hypothetical protein
LRRDFFVFLALLGCSQSQDFSSVMQPAPATSGSTADPSRTAPPGAPQPCNVGECVPTVIAKDQGLDPDHPDVQGTYAVVADDAFVYFMTAWSELVRVPRNGGKTETLAQTDSSPDVLKLVGEYLYFTSVPQRQILRMKKTGGVVEAVTPASSDETKDVQDFGFDGESIAWFDMQTVHRCKKIPCGDIEDLSLIAPELPGGIGVGFGHVLVATWEENAGNAGQGIRAVGEGSIVETFALDYRKILLGPTDSQLTDVFAAASNAIVHAQYPGTTPAQMLASGPDIDMFPAGLSTDATYLYWVNRGTQCIAGEVGCTDTKGTVMRVRKDGAAKPEVVLGGQPPLRDLALTADALFMTTGDGKVLRLGKPADTPLR